jgi:hypothetical protein
MDQKNKRDREKKSRLGHGCLSVVSVVCCQVEVSRRADPSSRGVLPTVVRLKSVIVKPRKMRRPRPPRGCQAIGEKKEWRLIVYYYYYFIIIIIIIY